VNGVRVASQGGVHGKHLEPVRAVHSSDGVQAIAFLNTNRKQDKIHQLLMPKVLLLLLIFFLAH
jgi:hypothetical protein